MALMSENPSICDGQIPTGTLFNGPMHVETVRPSAIGS